MWRKQAVMVAAVLALAACSSSGGGGPTTAPPATQASTAPPTTAAPAMPATTPEATAQGVALALDPCAVLPQAEASALLGVAAPAGKAQTLDGGGKMCVYAAGSQGVAQITLAQATSAADAGAVWDQERARANQALQQALQSQAQLSPTLSDLPGLGDKASTASYSATIGPVTIAGSAIYVLKGPTFFGVSVLRLNGAAPTVDALKAEAQTILGRI
jgi:branched-chain amino acid transport system substrate-binding protein